VDDLLKTFQSSLSPVSFTLSPDLTEGQRGELAVKVQFYGLLRLMMPSYVPYYAQEQIGVAIVKRACSTGTEVALETAVATARALVFEMGSTTPWLTEEFQDLRYVITKHVVNGAPVWAAENSESHLMYRAKDGRMWIGMELNCAAGASCGVIYNTVHNPNVMAPTQLLSNKWLSSKVATLGPQYTSAGRTDESPWVWVPSMRVTAVHGLDDAEPAMATALRQLAALSDDDPSASSSDDDSSIPSEDAE
jgi:hypothetical protein